MSKDQKWLLRFDQALNRCLEKGELNNERLADEVNLSKRQLFRRVKQTTKMSPQKYIRKYRLELACDKLREGKIMTVKNAAHTVGYKNISYFISEFEKEFGKRPFEILREFGWR